MATEHSDFGAAVFDLLAEVAGTTCTWRKATSVSGSSVTGIEHEVLTGGTTDQKNFTFTAADLPSGYERGDKVTDAAGREWTAKNLQVQESGLVLVVAEAPGAIG
jgi:hypothetical protein